MALTGDLVVPTLIAGDRRVVGFDPEQLEEIVRLHGPEAEPTSQQPAGSLEAEATSPPPGNSLEADQGHRVITSGGTLAGDLRSLLARIDGELNYNAAKGSTPFRLGMHDGLRFAQDAVVDLLQRHGHTAEIEGRPWDA